MFKEFIFPCGQVRYYLDNGLNIDATFVPDIQISNDIEILFTISELKNAHGSKALANYFYNYRIYIKNIEELNTALFSPKFIENYELFIQNNSLDDSKNSFLLFVRTYWKSIDVIYFPVQLFKNLGGL